MDTVIVFLASKLHVVIVITAFVIFLFSSKHQRIRLAMTIVLAAPLSYVLGKIASTLYVTERPFAELEILPLVPHIADNGFPSEHTLYAMVIAMIIFTVHKRWGIALIVLALMVGIGRVLADVHNPIDIVGSVLISIGVMYITLRILRYMKNRSLTHTCENAPNKLV